MKINQFTLAAIATLLSVSSLVAQQTLPGQTPTKKPQTNQSSPTESEGLSGTTRERQPADDSLSMDQIFAKCLAITNQEQVMIARFAKEKGTSDDVKAFAATLEKAHQGCLDELKGLVSPTQASGTAVTANSRLADNSSSHVDFLQIHQEMSDQCLKDSKEMLSKKEGNEFDKCFVGMQVAKHAMMHSSLTVIQRHTSGELQDLIKKGLAKNAEHMQASVQLMEHLTDTAVSKTAKNSK